MLKRILLIIIIYLFSFIEVVYSVPGGIYSIKLPGKCGLISSRWKGSSADSPVFINIQDAHTSFEAQKSIAGLISNIIDKKLFPVENFVICAEGGVGESRIDGITTYPFKDVRKDVADYFLKAGKINGLEYGYIASGGLFKLYGVENRDLYMKNYKLYIELYKMRDGIVSVVDEMENILSELKEIYFNSDLKKIEELRILKKTDPRKYFLSLIKYAFEKNIDLGEFINLSLFCEAVSYENNIDEHELKKEIENIEERIGRVELSEYKLSGEREYLKYLEYIALQKGIDALSNIKNKTVYLDKISLVDFSSLLYEADSLFYKIEEAYSENKESGRIIFLSRIHDIFKKIAYLNAVYKDVEFLRDNKKFFNSRFINEEFNKFGMSLSMKWQRFFDDVLKLSTSFYNIADERNSAIVNNSIIKGKGKDVVFLVTGGYHTGGITDILKKKGISYLVYKPDIGDVTCRFSYNNKMLFKHCGIEDSLLQYPAATLSPPIIGTPLFEEAGRLTGYGNGKLEERLFVSAFMMAEYFVGLLKYTLSVAPAMTDNLKKDFFTVLNEDVISSYNKTLIENKWDIFLLGRIKASVNGIYISFGEQEISIPYYDIFDSGIADNLKLKMETLKISKETFDKDALNKLENLILEGLVKKYNTDNKDKISLNTREYTDKKGVNKPGFKEKMVKFFLIALSSVVLSLGVVPNMGDAVSKAEAATVNYAKSISKARRLFAKDAFYIAYEEAIQLAAAKKADKIYEYKKLLNKTIPGLEAYVIKKNGWYKLRIKFARKEEGRRIFNELLSEIEKITGLDMKEVKATIEKESNGKEDAVSYKGAGGITQTMPIAIYDVLDKRGKISYYRSRVKKIKALYHKEKNISKKARYNAEMQWLIKKIRILGLISSSFVNNEFFLTPMKRVYISESDFKKISRNGKIRKKIMKFLKKNGYVDKKWELNWRKLEQLKHDKITIKGVNSRKLYFILKYKVFLDSRIKNIAMFHSYLNLMFGMAHKAMYRTDIDYYKTIGIIPSNVESGLATDMMYNYGPRLIKKIRKYGWGAELFDHIPLETADYGYKFIKHKLSVGEPYFIDKELAIAAYIKYLDYKIYWLNKSLKRALGRRNKVVFAKRIKKLKNMKYRAALYRKGRLSIAELRGEFRDYISLLSSNSLLACNESEEVVTPENVSENGDTKSLDGNVNNENLQVSDTGTGNAEDIFLHGAGSNANDSDVAVNGVRKYGNTNSDMGKSGKIVSVLYGMLLGFGFGWVNFIFMKFIGFLKEYMVKRELALRGKIRMSTLRADYKGLKILFNSVLLSIGMAMILLADLSSGSAFLSFVAVYGASFFYSRIKRIKDKTLRNILYGGLFVTVAVSLLLLMHSSALAAFPINAGEESKAPSTLYYILYFAAGLYVTHKLVKKATDNMANEKPVYLFVDIDALYRKDRRLSDSASDFNTENINLLRNNFKVEIVFFSFDKTRREIKHLAEKLIPDGRYYILESDKNKYKNFSDIIIENGFDVYGDFRNVIVINRKYENNSIKYANRIYAKMLNGELADNIPAWIAFVDPDISVGKGLKRLIENRKYIPTVLQHAIYFMQYIEEGDSPADIAFDGRFHEIIVKLSEEDVKFISDKIEEAERIRAVKSAA